MTKEELSQVYYLGREIEMWKQELKRLKNMSLAKGQEVTGMPFAKTNETSDKVANLATKIAEIEQEIELLNIEREQERLKTISYVNSLDDSFMRQIMKYRHVDCYGWKKVARLVGGDNTEDSVRKAHDRFLEKK